MNSFNTLDSSLFHRHDPHASSTPQNDISQDYHLQNYNDFHTPPGAEPMGPPPPPPPTQPSPATHSLQDSLPRGHAEIEDAAQMLTPFPMNDGSNNIYSPSPSRSASLSPSHLYPSRAHVHSKSHSLRTCSQQLKREPKDSGMHPFHICSLFLQVVHFGLTLTSEPRLNRNRCPRQWAPTSHCPAMVLLLPLLKLCISVHPASPLHLQSRCQSNHLRCTAGAPLS
jgi:hypothetical protein